MIELDTQREAKITEKLLTRQYSIVLDTADWAKREYAADSLLVQHIDAILDRLKYINMHTLNPNHFDSVAELLNPYTDGDNFDNEVWMLISLQDEYRFWHY